MTRKISIAVVFAALIVSGIAVAQGPATDINPSKHHNLAEAQQHIREAYKKIEDAQAANKDELGGHGEKAKEFLNNADRELKAAADYADHMHK